MDITDLQKQLLVNADFDFPIDVSRARRYVQAARRVLSLGVVEWYHGNERMRTDPDFLKSEIYRAEQFIAANSTSVAPPSLVHQSLENFRD